MKNFKGRSRVFLETLAWVAASLLVIYLTSCDGAVGEGDVVGDAGRSDAESATRTDAGRADAARPDTRVAGDVRVTSCQVPTPKFPLNGLVTATPRSGYVIVEAESVLCLTSGVSSPPTNCEDPVDGFASGVDQLWCSLIVRGRDGKYFLDYPYLTCTWTGTQLMSVRQANFGEWAVCSPSGKFLGWKLGL